MAKIGFGEHPSNIFERLLEGGVFPKFIHLIEVADMKEKLMVEDDYTVFVPYDEALDFAPVEKLKEFEEALKDKEKAKKLLGRYMLKGYHKISQIASKNYIETLSGEKLKVEKFCQIKDEDNLEMDIESGIITVKVNDAKVEIANVPCSNGIIHIINNLL